MKLLTKASSSDAVTQRELENLQVAYQAACEGMVLLKNDGALPFKAKKIALYGPGASMTHSQSCRRAAGLPGCR